MTELEIHQPQTALMEQMKYAQAVSTATMLPENYRGKPADIMLAVGLGSAMGLSPAESLYRISVIKGKPTASAELIAANVRKAGHKLRVRSDGKTTATAIIVRADDPDFPFEVTRDLTWAHSMGLDKNDNYRKQPGTMLEWRAIAACARLACPEALYGVAHTPDEVSGEEPAHRPQNSGTDRMRAMLKPTQPVSADEERFVSPEGDVRPAEPPLLDTSSKLAKRMFALFGEAGITDKDDRLRYVSDVVGREVATSKDMTEDDARAVCDALEADALPGEPA